LYSLIIRISHGNVHCNNMGTLRDELRTLIALMDYSYLI
jgi:hypothetical protein